MKNSQPPRARKAGLVVQEVPGEVLVFDTASNRAHCLNESAAMVWQACDGTRSAADIAEFVSGSSGEKVSEDFVWLAIDQLNSSELLEERVESKFSGMSRRQVIKTIGLTSMVALPVIASLVAPPSAVASSSCGCPSTQPSECTPKTGCPSTSVCNSQGLCAPEPLTGVGATGADVKPAR